MPVKTYTCAICGEEVTKRQSYSIGDNKRACRKHEEAQAKAEELKAEEKKRKDQEQAKIKEVRERRKREEEMRLEAAKKPIEQWKMRCFLCHKEGMRQDEYFRRVLIEQQKHKIIHGELPNPFDVEAVQKSLEALKGVHVLWFVEWKGANAKIRIPFKAYQMTQIIPWMLVCSECCEKKKFKRAIDERTENVKLDDLIKMSAVFQVVAEPIFEAQARHEMKENN